MFAKVFVGLVAAAGLAVAGVGFSPKVADKGCCYPGAPCCEAGLPCCDGGDCCFDGSPCCYPGSPCCKDQAVAMTKKSCCSSAGGCAAK